MTVPQRYMKDFQVRQRRSEKMRDILEKVISKPISLIAGVGMSLVVLIMLIMSSDVISRVLFGSVIVGSHELVEFSLTTMVFLGLAYTALKKGHIAVDIIYSKMGLKSRPFIEIISSLFSLIICLLMVWQTFLYAMEVRQSNLISSTLMIDIYPFVLLTSFGVGLLSVVILKDFVVCIHGLWGKK
jgi:TRAP-type C4-dicarboxylate transport system permease small subunit